MPPGRGIVGWHTPVQSRQKPRHRTCGLARLSHPTFANGITLLEADTLRLPFPDATFQIVSVAFGLRNLADLDAGLREMVRVCRPGGGWPCWSSPRPPPGRWEPSTAGTSATSCRGIGQALARNTQAAYNYLPQSVGRFPQAEALAERMRAAGLGTVEYHRFTCGVATLYVGRKDER